MEIASVPSVHRFSCFLACFSSHVDGACFQVAFRQKGHRRQYFETLHVWKYSYFIHSFLIISSGWYRILVGDYFPSEFWRHCSTIIPALLLRNSKPLEFLILYMLSLAACTIFSLSSMLSTFTTCFGGGLFSFISWCTLGFFNVKN